MKHEKEVRKMKESEFFIRQIINAENEGMILRKPFPAKKVQKPTYDLLLEERATAEGMPEKKVR